MNSKEIAKELVDKFKNRSIELGETHSQLMAEANALLAVEEISKHCYEVMKPFWEEVKTELQKL